jgi:hypothetical protein
MYTDATLPFPRGSTYKDGGNLVLADNTTCGAGIVGRLFETTDSSGRPLVLRAVRADAALTDVGGTVVRYTAAKTGSNIAGTSTGSGEISSIVDDAYPSTYDIAAYDVFYVVEEGYVVALSESSATTAGTKVMANGSGGSVAALTAGLYCIGIATETRCPTSRASESSCVHHLIPGHREVVGDRVGFTEGLFLQWTHGKQQYHTVWTQCSANACSWGSL